MKDPRTLADSFVRDLRGVLNKRVRAASLFGSAARGEWIEGTSDVNVLVLLDDIDAQVLAEAAAVTNPAIAKGLRPLLMEVDEWGRAADVFTIELADMKDAAVPLHGDDPAAAHVVNPAIMRLQAERELRAKLLHLHAGMLMAADDSARLGQLFVHALPSFTTYMRTALRLASQPVPRESAAVIRSACTLADADPSAFLRVLETRLAGKPMKVGLREPIADQFNSAAEKIAAFIDAFGR
ncbi:MAG: hypothetical protein WD054_06725 [Gemmatimonadota bacterium]